MDNGPFGTWYIIHIAITFSQTSLPLTSHLFVVGTTSMASYCFSWVINYIHYQVSIIKVLYKLKIVGALGCKGGASLTGSFLIGRMLLASNYSTRKKEPRYFMLPGAFPPSPLLSSSFIFSSHPLSFFHSDSKKKKKNPAITLILISSFSCQPPPSPLASPLPFCQRTNPHHQQATGDRGIQRPHRLCIPDREKTKGQK